MSIKVILTEQEINEIIEKCTNLSERYIDIARSYNFSEFYLRKIRDKYKIPRRTLHRASSLNESYFEKIDTPNKAYILGLLAADGYVYKKKGGQDVVGISLQERDFHILDNIKTELEYKGNINYRPRRYANCQAMYSLSIHSDKLSNDLQRLGIVYRKSLIYKFPSNKQVPDSLIVHFIRGYFDGDGCITKSKQPSYRFSVVGTKYTCQNIADILCKKYSIGNGKVFLHSGSTWVHYITGKENIKKLYFLFYENADMYLIRKKEKWEGVFEI